MYKCKICFCADVHVNMQILARKANHKRSLWFDSEGIRRVCQYVRQIFRAFLLRMFMILIDSCDAS